MKYKIPFRFNSHERKGIFLVLLVLFLLFYLKREIVKIVELTKPRYTIQVLVLDSNSNSNSNSNGQKTSNFPTAIQQTRQTIGLDNKNQAHKLLGEINSADTTQLKRIQGIGSVYSNRIVKFRKRLGGFVDIDQIGAVYGLNENIVDSIKKYFTLDLSMVKKISLEDANSYELRRYPFLSENIINEYLEFRTKRSTESVDSLTNFFKKRLNKYDFYLLYLYAKPEL